MLYCYNLSATEQEVASSKQASLGSSMVFALFVLGRVFGSCHRSHRRLQRACICKPKSAHREKRALASLLYCRVDSLHRIYLELGVFGVYLPRILPIGYRLLYRKAQALTHSVIPDQRVYAYL